MKYATLISAMALTTSAIKINKHVNVGVRFYPEEMVQVESDPICSSANAFCTEWKKDKDGHPMNYFVPNFGVDRLMNENHASLLWAEKNRNHTWIVKKEDIKPKEPVQYGDAPLDNDIIHSLANTKTAETKFGQWKL